MEQLNCFSTKCESYEMNWKIYYADNGIKDIEYKNGVLIGEDGDVPVKEIRDDLFVLCRPADGKCWQKWRINVAKNLKLKGVEDKNIKRVIMEKIFESVNSYKEQIKDDYNNPINSIIEKKRKFYFDVDFES